MYSDNCFLQAYHFLPPITTLCKSPLLALKAISTPSCFTAIVCFVWHSSFQRAISFVKLLLRKLFYKNGNMAADNLNKCHVKTAETSNSLFSRVDHLGVTPTLKINMLYLRGEK